MIFKKKTQQVQIDAGDFVSSRVRAQNKRVNPSVVSLSTKSLANSASWRPNASINNLEQEKKKEVDREIKEKNRRKRRRVRARVTLKLCLVVFAFVAAFFIIGLSSKRVHLNLDNGGGTSYAQELGAVLDSDMDGGAVGYIRPAFLRYRSIEKRLKEQRDELDNVKLHFNIFKMRSEAEIKTNTPLVKWIGADGRPSYVNQKGHVFEPPTSFVSLFNSLEIGGSGLGAEPGSGVLASSEKLAWVVGVIPVLRGEGIEPSKVNIDGQSFKSVELLLPGVETRIIFSIDEDVTRSGVAAARSIKFIQKGGAEALKGVSYIDVRTPERVVYK